MWPIDRILTSITSSSQSEPEINDNKVVIYIHQRFRSEASPLDRA